MAVGHRRGKRAAGGGWREEGGGRREEGAKERAGNGGGVRESWLGSGQLLINDGAMCPHVRCRAAARARGGNPLARLRRRRGRCGARLRGSQRGRRAGQSLGEQKAHRSTSNSADTAVPLSATSS